MGAALAVAQVDDPIVELAFELATGLVVELVVALLVVVVHSNPGLV